MKQSKFKPLMVSFDEESFRIMKNKAKGKLQLLDNASVWIANTIDVPKCDMRKLSKDMVGYFKNLMLETFMEQNTLGLSAEKLIEAKEIDLSPLITTQSLYDKIIIDVSFNKNIPSIKVERKQFEKWTKNENQNKMLLLGNKFIGALNDMDKVREVNKSYMSKEYVWKLTNGFVQFDVMSNKFFVNPEMLQV
jgi:hypothetical protein